MRRCYTWGVIFLCSTISLAGNVSADRVFPRVRLSLDRGWQAIRIEHAKMSEAIPSATEGWKDHDISGMPLPAGSGDVCQGWYRCRVTVPADWKAGTVWLRMENWRAARVACWVNGRRVKTEYWTGFLPVEWRIDELIKPGQENEIVLCFWSLDWARVQLKDKAITKDSEAGKEFAFLLPEAKQAGDVRYLVPTAYGNGDPSLCFVGPTGPIVLDWRNRVFIDSVLTSSRIDGPKLTVRTELRQADRTTKEIVLRCELFDGAKRIVQQERSHWLGDSDLPLTDAFVCPGAELWWPDSPKLYRLEVTLCEGTTPIDKKVVQVGFREVKTQGREVLFNGVVYHSFGASSMALDMVRFMAFLEKASVGDCFWHAKKDDIRKVFRLLKSQNIRMARLGQATYPEAYFDAADEEGFLLMAESALCNSCANSGIELDEFWDHWRDHMLGLVRRSGNHPSIIAWSLGNEVGHGGRGKVAYPRMAEVVKAIRSLDPSRLISCSGDGDVGGCADVVNLHYPQCGPGGSPYPGQDYPRSAFWLGKVDVWPSYYDVGDQKLKDKPLFFGEWDSLFGHPPQTFACVYGDEAFVGGAPGTGPEQTFLQNQVLHGQVVRQFIEAYRYNGVSHPSPWCLMPYMISFHPQHNVSSVAEGYASEMVMLLPMSECYFGEGEVSCKAVFFNDTPTSKDYTAYFRLEVGNKVANGSCGLWYGTDHAGFVIERLGKVSAGGKVEKALRFRIPPVDSPTPVRLYIIVNGDSTTVVRRTYEWMAYPKLGPVEPKYRKDVIGVFDPQGAVRKILADGGVNVLPLTGNFERISDCRVVLLAENSLGSASMEKMGDLKRFVEGGGRVICLQQDRSLDWLPANLLLTGLEVQNTHNFVRSDSHPVTQGVTNDQLRLWGQDLTVSRSPIMKSDSPGIRYLVDCALAGFAGMSTASLVELRYGDGIYLLCQMLLEKNINASPGAERVLRNMIRYAIDYQPEAEAELTILSKSSGEWRKRFGDAGVRGDGKGQKAVIWCDDTSLLSDQIVARVNGGDTLVLYDLDPKSLAESNKRFGLSVAFRQRPEVKKWWFANKTFRTNLLDGVSNQDLFYISSEMAVGAVFEKIDEVMRFPIDISSQDGLVAACEPVGLCQIDVGKGRIVFCQLNCFATKHYGINGERVFRQLAANLGLASKAAIVTDVTGEKYTPIDLRHHANMGFEDPREGDGQGGGFDQGKNDLGRFPVAQKRFSDVSFEIIDPGSNAGKSCILLRSAHTQTMPDVVRGITVKGRIDELAGLLASAWGPLAQGREIARIVLRYQDGATADLPIQYGRHVTDWWDSPQLLSSARPGWVGSNVIHSPITVYLARWKNPRPKQVVIGLDIVSSNTKCPLTIIGLTGVTKTK